MNLQSIKTPVSAQKLEHLLNLSNYNKDETEFLVKGFRTGFSIGYQGPTNRQNTSCNIPFSSWGRQFIGHVEQVNERSWRGETGRTI